MFTEHPINFGKSCFAPCPSDVVKKGQCECINRAKTVGNRKDFPQEIFLFLSEKLGSKQAEQLREEYLKDNYEPKVKTYAIGKSAYEIRFRPEQLNLDQDYPFGITTFELSLACLEQTGQKGDKIWEFYYCDDIPRAVYEWVTSALPYPNDDVEIGSWRKI